MLQIRIGKQSYWKAAYSSEAEIEAAILEIKDQLFGPKRFYLPVKKHVGKRGGSFVVPDGYLLDLDFSGPRLYVVENELASHHPTKHIAAQLLEYSMAFQEHRSSVIRAVHAGLNQQPGAAKCCEEYATAESYRNTDHFMDSLVEDQDFSALVIIDEEVPTLSHVLNDCFAFPVEIIVLEMYCTTDGKFGYQFEPFLYDEQTDFSASGEVAEPGSLEDLDTVVVPAWDEGFLDTFMTKKCWYQIQMSANMREVVTHIAVYRVAPTSAITHIADIESIKPYKDTDGFIILFAHNPQEIRPVKLAKNGKVRAPQSRRYTNREKLLQARTLDDLWGGS